MPRSEIHATILLNRKEHVYQSKLQDNKHVHQQQIRILNNTKMPIM